MADGFASLVSAAAEQPTGQGYKSYRYSLWDLSIDPANQIWAADIRYIPLPKGFMYLVAIMNWHSRRVLSYVYPPLDTDFCIEGLEEVMRRFGEPEMIDTDSENGVAGSLWWSDLRDAKHRRVRGAGVPPGGLPRTLTDQGIVAWTCRPPCGVLPPN